MWMSRVRESLARRGPPLLDPSMAPRVSGPALGGECEWIDGTIVLGERALEIHA